MKKYLKTIVKVGRIVLAFPFFILWGIFFLIVAGLTFAVDFISGERVIEGDNKD